MLSSPCLKTALADNYLGHVCYLLYVLFVNIILLDMPERSLNAASLQLYSSTSGAEMKSL
jgi:hypothetical protein